MAGGKRGTGGSHHPLVAMLLVRSYEAFPLTCPRCVAVMRIIVFITEAVDVGAILEHSGEPATPHRPGAGAAGVVRRLRGGRQRCRGVPCRRFPRPARAGVRVRARGVLVAARLGLPDRPLPRASTPPSFLPRKPPSFPPDRLPTGRFQADFGVPFTLQRSERFEPSLDCAPGQGGYFDVGGWISNPLSIVARIAELHSARLELADGICQPGLSVRVTFTRLVVCLSCS